MSNHCLDFLVCYSLVVRKHSTVVITSLILYNHNVKRNALFSIFDTLKITSG